MNRIEADITETLLGFDLDYNYINAKQTTNCKLKLYGEEYNLHTCSLDELRTLLVILHSLELSAKDLYKSNIADNIKISGYPIETWMDDIKIEMTTLILQIIQG